MADFKRNLLTKRNTKTLHRIVEEHSIRAVLGQLVLTIGNRRLNNPHSPVEIAAHEALIAAFNAVAEAEAAEEQAARAGEAYWASLPAGK